MGYFPFFMEIENKHCLIAGGGKVALRKVQQLLPFGPAICVVSPEFDTDLKLLGDQDGVTLKKRAFSSEDLDGADFVIAATSDSGENAAIAALCRERGIPVNVVDVKEQCTFLFPSIIKDGPVTVGISTGGASPALARYLRLRLQEAMPEGVGKLAVSLSELRGRVKNVFPASAVLRGELFSLLMKKGLENDCCLTEKMTEEIIREKVGRKHE